MSSTRIVRTPRFSVALVATLVLLSACGGSDEAAPAASVTGEDAPADAVEQESETGAEAEVDPAPEAEPEVAGDVEPEADEDVEQAPPAGAAGDGTATLSLDNGETYEFSVLCSLEPQIAAGSEILFTATSYDDPGLDITQFGSEGTVTDLASIEVFDASFETLWDANSVYEAFGGSIELSLEGSTITGTGSFYEGGDIDATPVNGSVVANC